MRFEKIPYDHLNARQKEQFNFQKIAATLAEFGFNCINLAAGGHREMVTRARHHKLKIAMWRG